MNAGEAMASRACGAAVVTPRRDPAQAVPCDADARSALADFDLAARFDPSVARAPAQHERLLARRVAPTAHSPEHLFGNLAVARPTLLADYPAPYGPLVNQVPDADAIVDALLRLDDEFRYKIHRRFREAPVRLSIPELIRRWLADRETLRVTNIFTRKTDIPRFLDPDAMCPFNLLRNGDRYVESLEMMTLMVATTGSVTESHSDDADVNNHCIVGRKLWLFWDSFEGVIAGVEDNERLSLGRRPRFDLDTFLDLPSSGWCVVEPGQTLFLPSRYAHKVIALERYLGVGGFFLAFPSILHSFARWMSRHEQFDFKEPLYRERKGAEIAERIERSLLRTTRELGERLHGDREQCRRSGVDQIPRALAHWESEACAAARRHLRGCERTRALRDILEGLANVAWSR